MEIGRALGDPFEEICEARVGAKGLRVVEGAGEVGFGEGCVNFVVANLMKQNRRTAFAAAQFGDKMVQALRRIWRNGAVAKRAYGVVFHGK